MVWTSPRTWNPGETVTALMMNTHVRDNLNALKAASAGGLDFSNLYMRTHPSSALASSRVYLDHADRIVVRDSSGNGELVSDWDDLEAQKGTTGAGALDTGAVAANSWYEIYAIRKSTDGTKNLLLHLAKDWTTDAGQQFTTTTDGVRNLRISTSTPTDLLAQGFKCATAGAPGPIVHVDVSLIRVGAVSGSVWYEIYADSSGSPTGTALATSDKLDAATMSTTATITRFVFRTPFTAADTSTQYHLVLNGDYTRSDTIFIGWRGVVAGGYANGVAKEFNGTVWANVTAVTDFNFKLYTERNSTGVTMPAGYDQKCLIGYVRTDGSTNFRGFMQAGRSVSPMGENTSGSLPSGVAFLIDASAAVPIPCKLMEFSIASDTALFRAKAAPVPQGYALLDTATARVIGEAYGLTHTNAIAGPQIGIGAIATETQAYYARTSSGNSILYMTKWEW